jgi:hypothetical protein
MNRRLLAWVGFDAVFRDHDAEPLDGRRSAIIAAPIVDKGGIA